MLKRGMSVSRAVQQSGSQSAFELVAQERKTRMVLNEIDDILSQSESVIQILRRQSEILKAESVKRESAISASFVPVRTTSFLICCCCLLT